MGKGIALQFKRKFPEMYKQYKNLCKTKKYVVGDVFKYPYKDGVVYNLATQETWWGKADLKYIEKSLQRMMEMAVKDGVKEIAMPAIGAGHGGLDWKDIKQLINNIAHNYPSIELYVVERYANVETIIRYIKKIWKEEDTMYYFHFVGEEAVRQVEITSDRTTYMSTEHPVCGDSFLCDQSLKTLDFSPTDNITKDEFEKVWTDRKMTAK